jgi:Ca2+/Na+ antiporter
MKNFLLLLVQIVGGVCAIGAILAVMGILWGIPMYLKGAEVPNDWRAAVAFVITAAVCFGIVYLTGRKQAAPDQ